MFFDKSTASRVLSPYAFIGLYLLLGLALLPLYRYQINPDGISYISIAWKYLDCDFANVVNGHWGPAFSWLLVPLLAWGIEPLLAVKILNLCIGAVTFWALHRMCSAYAVSPPVRLAVSLSLVPVLLYFAYHQITPDLLLTCTLLFYFHAFFDADYVGKKRGVRVGMLGGICYLIKSYCLPFFLAHFTLITVLYYLQCVDSGGRRKIIYNYAAGMLVFLVVSGVWIGLLSNKYGEFTTTTQTAHNYQGISPEPPEVYYFIPPPNDTAISVWEDPYVRIKKISWSPFKSLPAFKHWITFGLRNTAPTIMIVAGFSVVAFLLCCGYVLRGIVRPRIFFEERIFFFTFVSAALYAGGYCFILVDERYIWIVCLLLMLMGGHLLTRLLQCPFFQNGRQKTAAALVVFCLSFYVAPVVNLLSNLNAGREEYEATRSVQGIIPRDARIASNGDFYTSLFFCYHLGLKYYGTSESYEAAKILPAMDDYGIDYFLEWDRGVHMRQRAPADFKTVADGTLPGKAFVFLKRLEKSG